MQPVIRQIYRGPEHPLSERDLRVWLDSPPPWRNHLHVDPVARTTPENERAHRKGRTYVPTGPEELDAVNLALWLRRPLLVEGKPGIGKSSLAYGIAHSLRLGPPLRWEIHSQSTLEDGLYTYDAVGHFRASRADDGSTSAAQEFIQLGPLGTAFVPTDRPRVLLIDELDKAGWDLPNNLLHIFEEGEFGIPELYEQRQGARVKLIDSRDAADTVPVADARVRVRHHPVVVITSNGARELSPAFLRRCVRLRMNPLGVDVLRKVVEVQFEGTKVANLDTLLGELGEDVETDIALQALFAATVGGDLSRVRDLLRRS